MLTSPPRRRRTAALLALAAALTVAAPVVEARPGGGGSSGSRGSRTFDAPSATPTAPSAAQPMQRTQSAPGMSNPGMQAPASGRRFGGGFFAGLLGAGLLGALLGGGFFGGLGGIASFLGLLLQVGLVALLVMFAVRLFRRRNQPAAAHARSGLDSGQGPGSPGPMGGAGPGAAGGAAGMFGGQRAPQARAVQIGPNDYQAFERLLGDIQDAYSREDRVTLGNLTTPEMAGYFDEELRANAARGVVNRISDVKLLQGDLSEAWGEDRTDYATVAMRYALKDVTVERGSNRVVQTGEPEATELWTFLRQPGRGWVLSAIQQTR
ncbi:TIM44-like domain-containing protein [Methylobacterium sp. NEAU 140]|uniref:TIM44-like domain-containing protein n=1 Tax=Methylobacterium sp. NEAU 140 TaxID=3064945 RepID=UPI002732B77B|nr:TIM44-like domain-containing protein [Methylobacterium sp. NEAU 140]MDP4023096.1 TIM44-like domain-containing protein [Methylobacterium sp. NEAU 140]